MRAWRSAAGADAPAGAGSATGVAAPASAAAGVAAAAAATPSDCLRNCRRPRDGRFGVVAMASEYRCKLRRGRNSPHPPGGSVRNVRLVPVSWQKRPRPSRRVCAECDSHPDPMSQRCVGTADTERAGGGDAAKGAGVCSFGSTKYSLARMVNRERLRTRTSILCGLPSRSPGSGSNAST